ncbi:MAG: ferrous iron transport protein A [Rubinisphaera brasiliensis]|uniref:FeoA family protein n=1 Tax=Rubinisphaera brasiliensis (strain ATCC 49424 / DSM 5305 / JCM 21570 / IAM 15109 / NBRC 103401 / IFAM 1448) TaxID=756272 RepID=F0SN25_RUBBR|nr:MULTISPECIES: FeoA family protein [Rubinisphaera]ADY61054.1 FeoA family protein [Rubinisphaera brasiliensis DSM 5305]MBB01971.1 ferrous iron transport protein A [Planctomyces sp.]MBR9801908.1 ferrous iron transport protein A [bacterium]
MNASLNDLRPGESAVITEIEGTDAISVRLMELGLFEGETIAMRGAAPLGDPREFLIGGTRVSLRRNESARVQIRRDA